MPTLNIELAYNHMEKFYGKEIANALLARHAKDFFTLYNNAVEVVYAHATSRSKRGKEEDIEFYLKRLSDAIAKLSEIPVA